MPDNLDTINIMTRRYIRDNPKLQDNVFNQDPLNYFLRTTLQEDFNGGSSINENFIYDVLPGGGFAKGKTFNVAQKKTEQQLRFDVKFLEVAVTLYKEDFKVFNKGPLAATKLLQGRIDQGFMAAGGFVSIATYLPGVGQANYENNLVGLAEALNDGTTQSWNGATYPNYGGLTRAAYGRALTSAPYNVGGGSLEYSVVDRQYSDCTFGSGQYEPNLLITTAIGLSVLKTKFQTQQRFQDAEIASVGFRGLKFNAATVLASRYCPGAYITGLADSQGQDLVAAQYLTETTDGAVTTYPKGNLGSTSANATETLFILNARNPFLNYYVSNDEEFGGGFREFIPESNSTRVVGLVLLAHALTLNPRYHRQIYGFRG
jgi:hypothetical protein